MGTGIHLAVIILACISLAIPASIPCADPGAIPCADPNPEPDWVGPMREVRARFAGRPGTFAHFGDSITVSRAFWSGLRHERRNAPPEMAEAWETVRKHMLDECWDWKGPERGNEGRMTIRWAHENVGRWLDALRPEVALILFGTNDVGALEVEEYEAKTRDVVRRCLDRGTVVILSTMPPKHGQEEKAAAFAEATRRVARELRVPLTDYHAEILKRRPDDWDGAHESFRDASGDEYQVPTLISRDGVHPSNPRASAGDYSEEALRTNGYGLRSYLVLLKYAEVVRRLGLDEAPKPQNGIAQHVVVHHRPGEFAGWPANGGLWTWDDGEEALVAFCTGPYRERPGHDIAEPYTNRVARSLDGGKTWRTESPAGYAQVGARFEELRSPIDLSSEDLAVRCVATGYHGADDPRGGFLYSIDRGRTWKGPFRFGGLAETADLRDLEVTARTDWLVLDSQSAIALLSARTPGKGGTDRVFLTRTADGGVSFRFGGWIVGPEDPFRAVMPSTVRPSPARLVTAIRRRVPTEERSWVDAYASDDDGRSWRLLGKVGDTGRANGNPPALMRLGDGRLCCAYGNRDLDRIVARLSEDDGASWGEEIVVREGYRRDRHGDSDLGYPRLFQRPDGRIVTVYYWSTPDRPEACISATIWTPPGQGTPPGEDAPPGKID